MNHTHEPEDPRRRLLLKALAAGLFAAGVPGGSAVAEGFFGSRPSRLPPGQSVYRITGSAAVNGRQATLETRISPGDTVQTARDSELIFVAGGGHAMLLRSGSHLEIEAGKDASGSLLINGLRLLSGALLSVSRNAAMQVKTPTATIGIRGTGFYAEAAPALTYFCTCYGITDVVASADAASRATVKSKHHDRPLYILKDAGPGNNIRNAPMIDHTDMELEMLEALVGRITPFIFENDSYNAPRREY